MGGKGSGRPCQAPCGTWAKYLNHIKLGQTPCEACKQASRDQSRARYKPKKRKTPGPRKDDIHRQMVRQYKYAAGSCMDCGLIVDERTIVCFDLDHRDPQKKLFTISHEIGNKPINEMRDEINKCDVVCKNCHALRTHKERHWAVRRSKTTCVPTLFDIT